MSCVFGALLVFLTVRMARRLSRSTLVGAIAGVLLTFDGLAFTMSRIALLDIFQATFVLAAVAALIADRDWFRSHLARYLRTNNMESLQGAYGPLALLRPWRLVAGVMFGAACAVKWNSIYVVAVFGVLTVAWDIGARRLHTIMEMLLEDISFNASDMNEKTIEIDRAYVDERLKDIVQDQDLSRYIL